MAEKTGLWAILCINDIDDIRDIDAVGLFIAAPHNRPSRASAVPPKNKHFSNKNFNSISRDVHYL